MPITSMILECGLGQREEVAAAVALLPCAEVVSAHQQQLSVVLDTATQEEDRASMSALASLSGVVCATPVFTNREDLPVPDLAFPVPAPDPSLFPSPLEV